MPGRHPRLQPVTGRVATARRSHCRRGRRITLPPTSDEEVTPPTVAQVEAMARVMPLCIRAAIVTLAGSGLRVGELLGLKVSDVYFRAGTIRVERQRLQSGKIGPPKTAKSRRTVPVGEVVTDALLVHLAARPFKEWLFAMERESRSTTGAGRPSGTAPAGRSRQPRMWRPSARAASPSSRRTWSPTTCGTFAPPRSSPAVRASSRCSSSSGTRPPSSRCGSTRTSGPGEEDRTRAAMDAELGGLRTGCGTAGRRDPRVCRSDRPGDQAFLVSQKMRSISAMSSKAFSPVFGSVDALAAESAFRVSLTSWCSSGYFSKCGGLK